MLKIYKNDKNKVKQLIQEKVLDGIVVSNSNLIDDIILTMNHEKILECLSQGFLDYHKDNVDIPLHFIMTLAIASKMKAHTSFTDIPYAIQNHRALAELGYNTVNVNGSDDWLHEETISYFIKRYKGLDFINYYNEVAQKYILKKKNIVPNVHILDCTKMFGYTLVTLRGLYGNTEIVEEIRLGTATTSNIELNREIIQSSYLHANDILLMDRDCFSREDIYRLKHDKHIDVYIPLKKNLDEYAMATVLAEELDDWQPHPTRKNQVICHVPHVNATFHGNDIDYVVDFNTTVAWIEETQAYAVFATTDMNKTATDMIRTYELRTEIEENFRQLKNFWILEDLKNTNLNVISFHIVCVLFGYLFYQLYLNTADGQKYVGECLPVILKNDKETFLAYFVLYAGKYFCCMDLSEFIEFRDSCSAEVRNFILEFLK